MKILNLACGIKTSDLAINIDWSMYFVIRKNKFLSACARLYMNKERIAKLNNIPNNILVHDLRKGIPFENNSIDVVYHSHFLEHLERDQAFKFMIEIKRVLKAGAVHRIVVPDFERLCKNYLEHLKLCEDPKESCHHDDYIAAIIRQCVDKEVFGARDRKPWVRFFENFILGDARRRGEAHLWMYDRITLPELLKKAGFKDINIEQYNTSYISNWNEIGLDLNNDGKEYKPGSLYIEAIK